VVKRRPESSRDPRQERLERGKTLLAAWGFHEGTLPPGTPGSKILDALSPLIGRDPTCDLLIAERLGRIVEPAAAARLQEWERTATDKEVKREIRRSLFRLEQKGVKIEREEEPAERFTLAGAAPEPEGRLGPIDGEGSRIAWLLKPGRRVTTGLLAIVNDREGMSYVDIVSANRQALTETMRETSSSGPLVEVPWTYVDALMHAAFRMAPPRPGSRRADYLLSRGEITSADPPPVPPCPARELIPGEEIAETDLLENSADLLREKEFGSWVLPESIARPHLQQYVNATHSGLHLSKEAASERVIGIMDAAVEELGAEPWRSLYVRRMEEMAYILHLQDRDDPARRSLAVALALESPEPRRLKEISFLRALVFRAFAPLMASEQRAAASGEEASETAEGSSRILDPSKVRETREPDGDGSEGPDEGDPPTIIRP
jgi:hypothetical protein